jgi:hypothetical protein
MVHSHIPVIEVWSLIPLRCLVSGPALGCEYPEPDLRPTWLPLMHLAFDSRSRSLAIHLEPGTSKQSADSSAQCGVTACFAWKAPMCVKCQRLNLFHQSVARFGQTRARVAGIPWPVVCIQDTCPVGQRRSMWRLAACFGFVRRSVGRWQLEHPTSALGCWAPVGWSFVSYVSFHIWLSSELDPQLLVCDSVITPEFFSELHDQTARSRRRPFRAAWLLIIQRQSAGRDAFVHCIDSSARARRRFTECGLYLRHDIALSITKIRKANNCFGPGSANSIRSLHGSFADAPKGRHAILFSPPRDMRGDARKELTAEKSNISRDEVCSFGRSAGDYAPIKP